MSTIYVDRVTKNPKPETRNPGLKWSNGQHQSRNSYPADGGTKHLSNTQKGRLCILAKQAFAVVHHRPGDTDEVESWRRAEQVQCVGKSSLTTCTQGDYLPLLAHFAQLAGEDGVALKAHIQDSTSSRRVALHKLAAECKTRGLTLAWPTTICRSKFKCGLEEATAKQLWHLVFDVRNSKHKPQAGSHLRGDQVDEPF